MCLFCVVLMEKTREIASLLIEYNKFLINFMQSGRLVLNHISIDFLSRPLIPGRKKLLQAKPSLCRRRKRGWNTTQYVPFQSVKDIR